MDIKLLKDVPPWQWPENADQMFLDVLRDEGADEADRLAAVEMVGDYTVMNDEAAEALLEILLDSRESDELRGQAAISFGVALEHSYITEFEDEDDIVITEEMFDRLQQTLKKLYSQAEIPEKVRRRILEAAVRAPQEWHLNAVRAAYASDDEEWNLVAVFCMNFIRGFENEIVKALDSKNTWIRYHAVCAAGKWQVSGAWPHVSAIVEKETNDKDLLLAAIEAAAAIRPKEARETIDRFLDSDDEDIADTASEALNLARAFLEEEFYEDEDDEDYRH